jgi:hypothetical protein
MFHLSSISWKFIENIESLRFDLPPVVVVKEYVKFFPSTMLLPIVHRSFDVGGLKIEGPLPENPPFMAIITTLTRIPIAPNIPDARKTNLFGLITITVNWTLKDRTDVKKIITEQLCQIDPFLQNCLGNLILLLL